MKRDRYHAFLATVIKRAGRFLLLMAVYFSVSLQGTAGVISGTFTPLANSPANLTGLTVDPVNGYMYAFGVYSDQLYRYNISANSWSAISTSPEWLQETSLTKLGDNLYCASITRGDLLVYNIPGNSWSAISAPDSDNELYTTNIATDGVNIFVILDGFENAKFWRYNVNAGTWTALAPAPAAQDWGGLSYFNGYFYFHEGNSSYGFFRYHVASNSWESLDDVPGGPVQGSAVDDAYFYCMGDYYSDTLYSYDLNEHVWNNNVALPWVIEDAGMCTYQGSLYIIQGESNPGFTKFTPTNALLKNVEQGPLNYLIGSTATNITSTLTASKNPATNLSSAMVTISEGYENGKDVLSFSNSYGITGSWSAATGTLTLSGTTTIADYQSALRSVKYYNADNTSSGRRTITFRVYDGTNYSNTAAREITFSDLPVVQTLSALAVSGTTAKSGGMIIEDGGQSLTRGICWNTAGNPTLANNTTNDGSGLGFYTSSMTGLTVGTLYHIRAYARNATDTVYGQEVLLRATNDATSIYAGTDQTICFNDTAQLSGFAGGTSVVESYGWSTGGDGYFLPDTSSTFQPQYVPGANDISDGFATITLRATFSGPVTYTDDLTLTIQSESTPVSGTLNKTPNSANACAGTNVSATLTTGEGGNDTDETDYRTYDGFTWSSWTTYTPGTNISTTGKTSIEIRTRRMANCFPNSSYHTVNWSVYDAFTSGAINTVGDTICGNGDPSLIGSDTVASGGDNVISYQWQSSSVNSSTGYSNIIGATNATHDPPTGLTITTWYRRLAKDGTCNTTLTASSGVWQVTVRELFTAGAINTTGETICYNGNPSLIGNATDASGGDNIISYQWQSSTTNSSSGFADIGSATQSTYDPPDGLTVTTWYRREAKDGTCSMSFTTSSGVWKVTVHDNFDAGEIDPFGETICYNGDPEEIQSITDASGGDEVISYKWQSSANGTFTDAIDIVSATGTSYNPPAGLTATTSYRRLAKDGLCNPTYSTSTGTWTVEVRPQFTSGAIDTTGETICYNTSPTVEIGNITAASGGDDVISYFWRSSADNYSTTIPGADAETFWPADALTSTTSFRRYAKNAICDTAPVLSAGTWTVTVRPEFLTGAIETTGEIICYLTSPSLTIGNVISGSGGDEKIVYSWRSSADDFTTAISGATGSTYTPTGPLTETTSYRRFVNDSTCNTEPTESSGTWTVTVSPLSSGGTVSGGTEVCYGANSTLLMLSGHTGEVVKWQYSTDNTNWTDLSSQTQTTYTAENLTTDTWYRAVVQNSPCPEAYSSADQITIMGGFTISGYAKYENNPKTPLNGLKITLKKDGSPFGTPVTTGNNGYYEFTGLEQGNYGIEVSSAHPSGQWQTWGGVNNTDYLLVARHIAGTQFLPVNPPVVQVTASTKLPHPTINSADALAIRQAAKFPTTGYSYFDIPKWVFSGMDGASALDDITVVCSDVVRDIRGLCAGDVNGTYVPVSGYKTAVPGLELVHRGVLPISDEIIFPVRVDRDMELGAMTLYLNFDPSVMTVTNVTTVTNAPEFWFNVMEPPLTLNPSPLTTLQIGWMSLDPVSVTAGQAVILIHARMRVGVKTHGRASLQMAYPFRFTLNENPLSEFADAYGNVIQDLKLSMPVAGRDDEPVNLHTNKMVCYPNPASATLNIEIETFNPERETLVLELLNLQGVVVLKGEPGTITAGWHKQQMDVQGLAPGVYFLRALINNEMMTRKVVKTR